MTTKREKTLLYELCITKFDLEHQTWLAKFEKRWQLWFSLMALVVGVMVGICAGNALTNMEKGPIVEDYQQALCDLKFGEGFEPEEVDGDPRNIECEFHPNEIDATGIHVSPGW